MILEYVTGGELFDRVVRIFHNPTSSFRSCELSDIYMQFPISDVSQATRGKLSESEGRKLFQQLIDGVSYCHNKGVYHRDLKVETISIPTLILCTLC